MKKHTFLMAIIMAISYSLSAQDVVLNGLLHEQILVYDDEDVLINTSGNADTEWTGQLAFASEDDGSIRLVGTAAQSVNILPAEDYDIDGDGITIPTHLGLRNVTIFDNGAEIVEPATATPVMSEGQGLQVYPSLVSNELQLSSEKGLTGYALYDMQGRLLEQRTFDQLRHQYAVDLSNRQSGAFVMQLLESDGRAISKKIIKN